jgi:hypothetical protein
MVQKPVLRKQLLEQIHAIVEVGHPLTQSAKACLLRLAAILKTQDGEPATPGKLRGSASPAKARAARATRRPKN